MVSVKIKNSHISGHFSLLNPMIKIFLFCFYKIWFEPMFLTGSFAVLIRAAPPPFRIFVGELPRRRRRRKRFGLIQVSCTKFTAKLVRGAPDYPHQIHPQVEWCGTSKIPIRVPAQTLFERGSPNVIGRRLPPSTQNPKPPGRVNKKPQTHGSGFSIFSNFKSLFSSKETKI
jgi:hypothetical protein